MQRMGRTIRFKENVYVLYLMKIKKDSKGKSRHLDDFIINAPIMGALENVEIPERRRRFHILLKAFFAHL